MEATGISWKAPWAILENEFECMLANARHVKAGRGPQDRRLGRGVAVSARRSRIVEGELCAAQADPRATQPHALSQDADPRACANAAAIPQPPRISWAGLVALGGESPARP